MLTNLKSLLLVIVQYLSLILILLTAPVIASNQILLVLEGFGFVLGLWAIFEMRTSVLRISPEVSKESSLITTGPYRFIRHPMYLSILVITFSLILSFFSVERLILGVILVVNMILKMDYEEKLLIDHFKEYGTYKKKTPHKLIPFIY